MGEPPLPLQAALPSSARADCLLVRGRRSRPSAGGGLRRSLCPPRPPPALRLDSPAALLPDSLGAAVSASNGVRHHSTRFGLLGQSASSSLRDRWPLVTAW